VFESGNIHFRLSCPCDVNFCIVHINRSQRCVSFLDLGCIFWASGRRTSSQKNDNLMDSFFRASNSVRSRELPRKHSRCTFRLQLFFWHGLVVLCQSEAK
jgi:hypothetical protein